MSPREFQDGQWVQLIGSIRQGDAGTVRGKAWGEELYDVMVLDGELVRIPGSDLAAIEMQEPVGGVDAGSLIASSLATS
ncbi:MAG: hypothetical protein SGI86_01875 [Deltaproteobacteria bacterium]|nr:hypothetical protein [Deltaproteobacteria bacterium]